MPHTITPKDICGQQEIKLASSSTADGSYKELILVISINESFLSMDYYVNKKRVEYGIGNIVLPKYAGANLASAIKIYNDIDTE